LAFYTTLKRWSISGDFYWCCNKIQPTDLP